MFEHTPYGDGGVKNAISPFSDSRNKNIGASIRNGREIWCLPYAGFKNSHVATTLNHARTSDFCPVVRRVKSCHHDCDYSAV